MIRTDFFVSIGKPAEEMTYKEWAESNASHQRQAAEILATIFGGVTVLPMRGHEWINGSVSPAETGVVFTVVHSHLAAEMMARRAADTLLDIFDDQQRVMFTQTMVSETVVSRPAGNASTLDTDRVVKPSIGEN